MGDAPAPPPLPTAIRITRPYASEDEFLDRELETLTRASITLLGAQARPQGVVLRFELALSSGLVLMRGEGRVVGFKANAFEGIGGLTLRFTRLDTRSKALVDRAAALREMRRPSTRPPEPADSSNKIPDAAVSLRDTAPGVGGSPELTRFRSSPPPLPEPSAIPASPAAPQRSALPQEASPPEPAFAPAPAPAPAPEPAFAPAPEPAFAPAPEPAFAPERDSLLERLRARARALDPEDVAKILATRRRA